MISPSVRFYPEAQEFLSFSYARGLLFVRDRRSEESEKEKEKIIAELCVDLIEQYGYRLGQIAVSETVPILAQSGWDYPVVDILVRGDRETPTLLIAASAPDEYEAKRDSSLATLFSLAPIIKTAALSSPLYLIYHTRSHQNKHGEALFLVIDYQRTPTLASWDRAGRPSEPDIPRSSPKDA